MFKHFIGMSHLEKNYGFSAIISLFLALVTIAIGQIFKEQLALTRQGILLAGGIAIFFILIFRSWLTYIYLCFDRFKQF